MTNNLQNTQAKQQLQNNKGKTSNAKCECSTAIYCSTTIARNRKTQLRNSDYAQTLIVVKILRTFCDFLQIVFCVFSWSIPRNKVREV